MTEKCRKCINFVEKRCDNDVTITDEFSIIYDALLIFEERVEKLEEKVEKMGGIDG